MSGDPKEIRSEVKSLQCHKGAKPWVRALLGTPLFGCQQALGGRGKVPAYPVTLCPSLCRVKVAQGVTEGSLERRAGMVPQ